jgi:PPP family 3-phenylpropionic acid transporter
MAAAAAAVTAIDERAASRHAGRMSGGRLSATGVRATLVACLFFAGFGCLIPFLPVWLEKVHGFTGAEIGLVLAIGGFSRVIAGPLTAAWSDGRGDRRAPLFLFAALMTLGFGALGGVSGFGLVFALVLAMDVAAWGFVAPLEATLLRLTRAGRPNYGVARGLGSAAFVLGSTAVGLLVDRMGAGAILGWMAGISLMLLGSVALLPPEPSHGHPEAPFAKRLAAGLALLKDRRFALLISALGLIQATHSYFYVAGTLVWINTQGISPGVAGMLWSTGVIAEVAFLVLLAGWSERFPPEALVVAGGLAAVVRWTAMAALPPLWLLFPLQLLHAGTFALTFLGGIRLINRMFGDDGTPQAQMIYMGVASAPAQALLTLASGPLYDALLVRGVPALGYLVMSAVAALGFGLALVLWRGRNAVVTPFGLRQSG